MSETLTPAEIAAVTGYRRRSEQLRALHDAGFWRARLSPLGGIIVERAHYAAVCAGAAGAAAHTPKVKLLARR